MMELLKRTFRPLYNILRGPLWERHVRLHHARVRAAAKKQELHYDEEKIGREVRTRVKAKNIESKRKGDLRIFTSYTFDDWTGEQINPALEEFGENFHFDVKIESLRSWFHGPRTRYNRELLEAIKSEHRKKRLDAFLFYGGGICLDRNTLKEINLLGIATLTMGFDDMSGVKGKNYKGTWLRLGGLVEDVDLCYTSTYAACYEYLILGGRPLYLPLAGNERLYVKTSVAKDIDVLMLGWRMPSRAKLVAKLRKAGVKVVSVGPGWPSGRVALPDLVDMSNRAKIVIGSGDHNSYNESDRASITTLKARDFEIPLTGSLYVTTFDPELQRCYDIGSEILCYRDNLDLELTLRNLLANDSERERIARSGFKRATEMHTWGSRLDKILRFLGILSEVLPK